MLFAKESIGQNKQEFSAFGHTPKVVNSELYKALFKAKRGEERLLLLDSIGNLFNRPNNPDSLLHYGSEIKNEILTHNIAPYLKDKYKLKALLYKGLGSQSMGLLDEAIGYFIEGISIENKDTHILQQFRLGLADTYLLKRNPIKVKAILDEMPINTLKLNLHAKYFLITANYYILNNQFNEAEELINTTLNIVDKEAQQRIYLNLKESLGRLKFLDSKFNESFSIFSSIKEETLAEGYYDIYTSIMFTEGKMYSLLKNQQIAEMALNTAYVNALNWNRLDLQKKIINALVKVYNEKEDYKNAYNLKTHLDVVNAEILDKQNQRALKDLEFKYETLKKEEKINTLQLDTLKKEKEIAKQKTIKYAFLIGFLVVLIPTILLLVVYYQKLQTQSLLNKKQEALNQQEMASLLQTQELDLAKNTIVVQNNERDRIARELHDSIGGNIAGIKLQITNFVDTNPEATILLEQLDKTYQHVRDISHSLIPTEFKENNFTVLVKNYINTLRQNNTVIINFDAHPEQAVNNLNYALQSGLLNIIKELITNAFKHAKASEIDLQISSFKNQNSIELIYEDDGVGFNIKETHKGIGLQNIEHRVTSFKGQFLIDSALNRGTVITISIPLKK